MSVAVHRPMRLRTRVLSHDRGMPFFESGNNLSLLCTIIYANIYTSYDLRVYYYYILCHIDEILIQFTCLASLSAIYNV